jgi:glutaminyl-tRNA synthetase
MSSDGRPSHFLAQIVEADLAAGRNGGRVVTRFPPEPNGFLHIGHAKSVLLNFGLARHFGGRAHLRFDDTNPAAEDEVYVRAIQEDVRWLGCDWGRHLYYASDYFERMYECGVRLVREGKAYVDSQPVEAIREQRGSFERPGRDSPFRDRPVAENLALFRRMREGAFPDGACVLRARIDMAHPNVLLRDPLLYRIRHARHHRTGDAWCIYPMYDYAHPLEDAFEGVTHSICTLEFESNRELYDWVLDSLGPWDPRPRQYEFARLALGYTVLSKRKLLQLVQDGRVSGWDDPRMPTLAGLRRRGVTPEALREFADLIGVAKNNSVVDIGKLEYAIRSDLEARAPRAMAVLRPLEVVVETWPEDRVEELDLPWWPAEPDRGGTRKVPFGRHLLVERDDFSGTPPKDWKRLAPGREVRLAGAYVLRCEDVVRDASGAVRALRCSHDPASRGAGGERRRGIGTIHWVHATRSVRAAVRLYDRLFTVEQPDATGDFLSVLNPESLVIAEGARVEPAIADAAPGARYQFLRQGYFHVDPVDSRPGAPVFNRTISLKDTWGRTTAADAQPRSGREVAPVTTPPSPSSRTTAPSSPPRPALAARPSLEGEARVRFDRYRALGLGERAAERIAADPALVALFEPAVAVHPSAPSVARWLLNELVGLANERGTATLPIGGSELGRFVAIVDAGRVTQAAGKALLASLVERGGDPDARLRELGLAKVEDRGVVEAAITRVLERHGAEVERYRAGEAKLLGFLLGAAMRETQGAADPALVRQALQERLGGQRGA